MGYMVDQKLLEDAGYSFELREFFAYRRRVGLSKRYVVYVRHTGRTLGNRTASSAARALHEGLILARLHGGIG